MTQPLAIFDWSGVISDDFDNVLKAINRIFSHFGKNPVSSTELRQTYSPNPQKWYEEYGITDWETIKILYTRFHKQEPPPKPIPGAIEAVSQVTELADVTIFSSHPLSLLIQEAEQYGLPSIRLIGNANKTHPPKDLALCLDSRELSRVLYFGDTTVDIELANQTGLVSVAVAQPQSYHQREKLQRSNPNHVIDSITKAPQLILEVIAVEVVSCKVSVTFILTLFIIIK